MAGPIVGVVRRVRGLAVQNDVRFILKAVHELAALGLDAIDACEALAGLKVGTWFDGWIPR